MITLDLEPTGPSTSRERVSRGRLWLLTFGLLLITCGGAGFALAEECTPVKLETYRQSLAAADAAVRKTPEVALEKLNEAEPMVVCLTEPVGNVGLSDLFRLKAIAQFLLKNNKEGVAELKRAVAVNPSFDCLAVFNGYGPAPLVKEISTECQTARSEARQTRASIELAGLKGVTQIYVDGVVRTISEETVALDVAPGKHLVRVMHPDGNKMGWVDIKAPEDEDARAVRIDLKRYGLVPLKKEVVATGTVRVVGLPEGSEVLLDDRTRRDLPVLRNVEAGERHILIRTPDGSVLGGSIQVAADAETVYKVELEPVQEASGTSVGRLAAFGSLGLAALSAVGSGVTLGLAQSRYSQSEALYQEYKSAGSGANFGELYAGASSMQQSGYSMETTGLVLGGVAVLAAGAGGYLLFSAGNGGVSWLHPWVAPLPGGKDEATGVAMGVQGQF